FGLRFKSMDDSKAKGMPGIKSIFTIDSLTEGIDQNFFDTTSFTKFAVVVGDSTWEVLEAKKALNVEWEEEPERPFTLAGEQATLPAGLENSETHRERMEEFGRKPGNI